MGGRAIDEEVAAGTGIGTYGRDELLEELVGFANASGGVIILGIAETPEKPPRAKDICAIPHVLNLEQRLKNHIVDQIEPRLPFATTHSIIIQDDGSGVLLIETQASTLGPHWVRSSRKATIRREDKNMPLSMSEIHDMVLRNARRFDDLSKKLDEASQKFEQKFLHKLNADTSLSPYQGAIINLERRNAAACGIKVTIMSHQSLGLARIESFQELGQIGYLTVDGRRSEQDQPFKPQASARRVLGGVEAFWDGDTMSFGHRIMRDGIAQVEFVYKGGLPTYIYEIYFAAVVANALAFYDALRRMADDSEMPGEISVDVLSLREIYPAAADTQIQQNIQPFPYKLEFPRNTVSDRDSFASCLQELCADLRNAANLPAYRTTFGVGFDT